MPRNTNTRTITNKAQQEKLKSAITHHRKRENRIMDRDNARVLNQENNRHHRWIKEDEPVNRDEGADTLSHTWRAVLGGAAV